MRLAIIIAVVMALAAPAVAQQADRDELQLRALAKWRSCVETAARRYARSAEAADVVARAAMSQCPTEAANHQTRARAAARSFEQADIAHNALRRTLADIAIADAIEARLPPQP